MFAGGWGIERCQAAGVADEVRTGGKDRSSGQGVRQCAGDRTQARGG